MPPSSHRNHTSTILTVLAVALGIGAGVWVFEWRGQPPSAPVAVKLVTNPEVSVSETLSVRPAFELPDLDGVMQPVSRWDGKLLVLNFWATWCGPCRHEIPYFVTLQNRYQAAGLQVVGIAIDTPANVSAFYTEMGMNYPTLLGQAEAIRLGEAYGNKIGGLPYTVFIDRDGHIARVKNGPMELDEMDAVVKELL